MKNQLIGCTKASKLADVSRATIYVWIKEDRIKYFRSRTGRFVIDLYSLLDHLGMTVEEYESYQ